MHMIAERSSEKLSLHRIQNRVLLYGCLRFSAPSCACARYASLYVLLFTRVREILILVDTGAHHRCAGNRLFFTKDLCGTSEAPCLCFRLISRELCTRQGGSSTWLYQAFFRLGRYGTTRLSQRRAQLLC